MCNFWHKMEETLRFVQSLSELQKNRVADIILPGIHAFLDDILSKESLSDSAESFRIKYVSLLKCSKEEALQRSVECREETTKHETYLNKISKLGQVEEKRLISIRQFQLNQSEDKPVPNKRMELDSPPSCNTDDESRLLTNDDNFVELTKSDDELSTKEFSKLDGDSVNNGFLFHKENDGLRRRWCVLDEQVLKCYKRQNQNLVFEIDFRDGHYSAIQGRIGKMYAIRLSSAKAPRSHLFASPKAKVCTSWMMRFRTAGVQLQTDILREVSMNQQNNNKVTWALRGDEFSGKNEFASDLQEALELIERTKGPHILPKRSSYSFKELDVLRKLKASLVSKKSESKLNRRKTWSAGSLPISIVNLERFRNPLSVSDCNGLASKKEKSHGPNKSLPEILTSSGIVKIDKQDCCDLDTSVETVDPLSPSEDEPSFAMSMPEGLHKQHLAETKCSAPPRGSIVTQSVPDLLILPGQESPNQSFVKQEKHLKTSVSLSRVMSMKASLMKNAIITGLRRKGRRGSSRIFLDRELADIHGCLYRKKGSQWKERWCIITKETFYAFRDSLYENEDFSCSLRKCIALRCAQEPWREHIFKLVRRKGDEILLAAEDLQDLERWMEILQREAAKQRFSEDLGGGSRSSSLTTTSLFSVETLGDSSAAEDTPTDVDQRESFYADTTDKDSSDENSASGISIKPKPRGHTGKGYVYYFVAEDTWEHCWMEVSFGVLSIFTSQTKETVLQRDHIALCDIQENNTDSQRSHSFELKRPGRKPIYLEVDSEADFVKWLKCFKSWKKRDNNETTESKGDTRGYIGNDDNDVTSTDDTLLTLPPRSSTIGAETPATSDSDCCTEGTDLKKAELERPKPSRRTMTSVLSQISPKGRRRNRSTAGTIDTSESHKTAVKSSFLYYKANSGLWVKHWCVLESSVIFCFNSPEETKVCFAVDVQGCEVRRTSCKSKSFTFDILNRELDNPHFEFAGESTYVMYAWMRVLKIAAGLGPKRTKSEGALLDAPDNERVTTELKITQDTIDGAETAEEKDSGQEIVECQDDSNRSATSAPTSPKRKTKITSLDQVLKLLHEKQLEQQLQNKDQSESERARLKWQHSMLVVLRKSRSLASLNSETNKPSATVVSEPETVAPPELDEKTARVLHREISEKYDHILEDEKLKMLRRETLLKKRRNSLILQQDILEKKLVKCRVSVKAPIKKRQSKSDAKEMACFTVEDSKEVAKQLGDIKVVLDGIQQDIDSNFSEQKKTSDELNEQKRKELHELRITVDMSQQQTKTTPQELPKFRCRQVSDSSLSSVERVSDDFRKMSSREHTEKPKLTQSLSTPVRDLRAKAKSFSASRLPKAPSSPLLRTKTIDNGSGLGRPQMKSRASKEVLSLALSQIEDFEAFVQGSYRTNGADIGC